MIPARQSGFILGKIATLVGLVFILLGLLVYARQASENEFLYQLKILGDEIEYRITPTKSGKVSLRLSQLEEKTLELRQEPENAPSQELVEDTKKFEKKSEELKQKIDELEDSGKKVDNLNSKLRAILDSRICALKDRLTQYEGTDEEKIKKGIEKLEKLMATSL